MQIPYEVTPRPDTGLANAKLGIWLFLASEVMLFGGLFSGYIFLRLGAEDGYWPHGLLNVPVGTFNTIVLIASSVTVVMAWANLKMRRWVVAQRYLLASIVCGALFLVIKLSYEYPQKFQHFGAFIYKDAAREYEQYLGNDYLKEKGLPPRYEITGHLHAVEVEKDGKPEKVEISSPGEVDKLRREGAKIEAYEMALDPVNADPTNPASDRPHFWYQHATDKIATIHAKDVQWASSFAPKHSPYFAIYFTITGLHGLHVLGGVVVMIYFYFFGAQLYRRNPEHQANRIEVVGLFWHFVDLIWIFVFPIFYLL